MTAPAELFHVCTPLADSTDELIPLSALAAIDPVAHAAALAKYDDTRERRRLRDTVIPILGCRWIDVVFLSPVHPHAVWRAWRDESGAELPPMALGRSTPGAARDYARAVTAAQPVSQSSRRR